MNQKLKTIQKTFVLSIVALVTVSLVSLGSILYITNAIEVSNDVSSSHLHDLTKDHKELEAYLQTQKHAEPHFITIANLIQRDQQTLLTRALLLTGLPVLLLSAILAYTLARKLVRPVEETFVAQERFLQDASHEMRNPLAALYAVIQEAKHTQDPKTVRRSLHTLERQTEQLIKLNEDLLLLERTKTRHTTVAKHNVSDLLLDVIDSEYAQANQRKIRIIPKVTKNVFTLINDSDWVCITRNIVDNAVKYSKDGGVVTVRLTLDKQTVRLRVTDKGIGIPKEQLEQIGERFYRGSNVGRTTGTGLGMAIVTQIVTLYGGEMLVESTPNKGTSVTVQIPQKLR